MVRWISKTEIDLSSNDAIPVTDISNGNTDGFTTPSGIIKGGTFIFVQDIASTNWSIFHNLGYFPNITLVDSSGKEFEAGITHIDETQLQIDINIPISGKAYLK